MRRFKTDCGNPTLIDRQADHTVISVCDKSALPLYRLRMHFFTALRFIDFIQLTTNHKQTR